MDIRATVIHVGTCLAVGAAIAALTPAKWLAASFWISAAMFISGAVAEIEDSRPGGFENPDGLSPSPIAVGSGALKFTLKALVITAALAAVGLLIQFAEPGLLAFAVCAGWIHPKEPECFQGPSRCNPGLTTPGGRPMTSRITPACRPNVLTKPRQVRTVSR